MGGKFLWRSIMENHSSYKDRFDLEKEVAYLEEVLSKQNMWSLKQGIATCDFWNNETGTLIIPIGFSGDIYQGFKYLE